MILNAEKFRNPFFVTPLDRKKLALTDYYYEKMALLNTTPYMMSKQIVNQPVYRTKSILLFNSLQKFVVNSRKIFETL